MAKKRGRPPKTPTSTSKGPIDETVRPTQTPHKPDFSGLDEEELADIDSLTPKEALLWMEKIDLLRERVKEKTNPKPSDDPTVACGTKPLEESVPETQDLQSAGHVKQHQSDSLGANSVDQGLE
ncbi:hypothetical protein RIF29_14720 [Crotalaria pallida]|uniref:Uncharacterized protein n=1 Tax=Crotalaria pallida TaxID=3830 RepID=A0AAN9FC52_CROPI